MYVYAAKTGVEWTPSNAAPPVLSKPSGVKYNGESVYRGPGSFIWKYSMKTVPKTFPVMLSVKWQACAESGECYFPSSVALAVFQTPADWNGRTFSQPGDLPFGPNSLAVPAEMPLRPEGILMVPDYKVLRTASGYMTADEFLGFLQDKTDDSFFKLNGRGFWMMLVIVLLGGMALNLTPCVLPLIPVNLAMIGAGKNAVSGPFERWGRGLIYGAGITVAYGLLGVIAVLTGSTFGSLAANWFFNALAAIVFLILALAQFDLLTFDLSRFGSKIRIASGDSVHAAGIFLMGALSATLAGACVAPVLAAVLIQSAGMYAAGDHTGLFLPFLLGLGMALPWPFAAAGMALFPKPGAWMVRVKQLLGILIVLLALYYGWTAFTLLRGELRAAERSKQTGNGMEEIASALEKARDGKKLVLLDFGASWCKNCTAMNLRTMQDDAVRKELETMIVVHIAAENPDEASMRSLLERFEIRGFPSFVLLAPVIPE